MKKKLFISIPLILLTLILVGGLLYLNVLHGEVQKLKKFYPYFNIKTQKYELVEKRPKSWVSIDKISKYAKWAIIVSEDWAFYDHNGLDFNQLERVIEESVQEQKLTRGASTITQQVIKNALLSSEKTIIRKAKEMVMAYMLEKIMEKDQILENYLNLIELGSDLYGIKLAADYYFQKKPAQLNAKEGAFLAMLLPSPKRYSQSFRNQKLTKFASQQIQEILVKLRQAGIITEEERQRELRQVLSFEVINYFGEDLLDIEKEAMDLEIESELIDPELINAL